MIKKTKKQLQKEIAVLEKELYKINSIEKDKRNKRLLGRCFKYLNSSCEDKWWLYKKVTKIEDGGIYATQFEKTPWSFEIKEEWHNYDLSDGYTEISRQEYDEAWSTFLAELQSLN